MTGRPILGYWNVRGYAHSIRFLLNYLNVDYEDKEYGFSPAPDYKKEWREEIRDTLGLDFPNVPYWIDGDLKMTESRAILRHVARKYGQHLLPSGLGVEWKADMMENFLTDILHAFTFMLYHYTDDVYQTYKEVQPKRFEKLEKFIDGNDWVLGEKITYLDFFMYETLYQHTVFQDDTFNNFPNLQRYIAKFEELPEISAYISSPRFIKSPCYTPVAKYFI